MKLYLEEESGQKVTASFTVFLSTILSLMAVRFALSMVPRHPTAKQILLRIVQKELF